MSSHDLIFSSQRRHRIARHLAFWGGWCVAYLLLFHYPLHSFAGWGFSKATVSVTAARVMIQQIGLPLFVLKTLIFNSLLMVVVPQTIFTYVLIYWLLPNYFFKKRNVFLVAFILISVFVVYYFIASQFKVFSSLGDYIFGLIKNVPTFRERFDKSMYSALREQLSSLPVIAGFAVMIKLIKRWWLKQKETEQLASEKAKAELQLLKAQIHPHFLFNTLNNIYFFTLSGSPKAPEMIKKLSGMLHYILNECNQPTVPLEKELKMIQDYIALEKIRYGDQLKLDVHIPLRQSAGEVRWGLIAPLLLIPFIENSFKHGASKMLTHPYIKLNISIEENNLLFLLTNNKQDMAAPVLGSRGIGLKNVKKRLQLLYPGTHELNIVNEPESFIVFLKIKLLEMKHPTTTPEEMQIGKYELA